MKQCDHHLELMLSSNDFYWKCIYCEAAYHLSVQPVKLGDLDKITTRLMAESREWALKAYAKGTKVRCTQWIDGLWIQRDGDGIILGPCNDKETAVWQLFKQEWRGWESYER